MTALHHADDPAAPPTIFEARLSPRGSLSRQALRRTIAGIWWVVLVLATGLVHMGLWPVAPFMIASAACLSLALRLNGHPCVGREHIHVDRRGVTITIDRPRRPPLVRHLPLYGLTLERDIDPDYGLRRLRLSLRGRAVEIARQLAPCERAAVADALEAALAGAHCPLFQRHRRLPALAEVTLSRGS